MENELKQARTMAEILAVCAKYYDLNEPLGIATKIIVERGVKSTIKIIKAKPLNNGT
jgi:hypothetical protein